MKHYGNIDLNFNQLQNAALATSTNFPATPIPGLMHFMNKKMYICAEIAAGLPVWIPVTQEVNTYVHDQASASSAWTINHSLNTASAFVQVYDASGRSVIPDYIDDSIFNQVTVMFSIAQAGRAVVMLGSTSGAARPLVAYEQAFTNTTTIVVNHGLGYFPEINVYVGNNLVQPLSIVNNSTMQATVTFTSNETGVVRCI